MADQGDDLPIVLIGDNYKSCKGDHGLSAKRSDQRLRLPWGTRSKFRCRFEIRKAGVLECDAKPDISKVSACPRSSSEVESKFVMAIGGPSLMYPKRVLGNS